MRRGALTGSWIVSFAERYSLGMRTPFAAAVGLLQIWKVRTAAFVDAGSVIRTVLCQIKCEIRQKCLLPIRRNQALDAQTSMTVAAVALDF